MNIRDLPIARKLSVLLAFNTALAVLSIALVFTFGTALIRYRDAQEQLRAMAEVIGENSRAALAFNDQSGAKVVLQSLRAKQDISSVTVSEPSGRLFARADFEATHGHAGSSLETIVNALFPARIQVSRDIVDSGTVVGRIDLTAHLFHLWIELLKSLAFMVPIAVGLAALAVYFGLRLRSILIDPVLGLAQISHRVSQEQDYSLRATKQGKDEVGDLVDDFNHMLAEIQMRDEALRRERALLEQRVMQRTADLVQAVEEANRANRVKSEFLSTVSHELRTPLTAMSGSIGLLAGGALGELPAPVVALLQIAQKNGLRLNFLIDDLLDIEKLMAGKVHFDMRPQALLPLLEQALTDNDAYAKKFHVRFALQEGLSDVQVLVDEQRLHQVLTNLLSNAAKFSPEGTQVDIGMHRTGDQVRVTVTDHGPGVPDGFRTRIFQKFSQADASDTRQKGGTGLGLAISRELIERMGGQIGFDSVEGDGACFYFDLPLYPTSAADAVPPGAADHRPRILVVEDDLDMAGMLSQMLSRAGYTVDCAATAAEALNHLGETTYAAMTLDLLLPDMNGQALIRQLRQRPATAVLPIVVISAAADSARQAWDTDANRMEWLAKPIDQSCLLAGLDRLLAPGQHGHPRVLHVEDDRELHEEVRSMAGGRFNFELVTTLREARARVALERFDVVILDIGLPNESGWDLLPEIRSQQPGTRVVVLTGGGITEADSLRVDAVLQKSQMSSQQLLDAIDARPIPERSAEVLR